MKQSQHTRAVLAETLPGRRAVVMGQCLAAQPRGDGPGANEDTAPASARGPCPAVRDAGMSRVAQDLCPPSPMQTILPMQTIDADNNESREPTGCVMPRLSVGGARRSSLWRRLRPRAPALALLALAALALGGILAPEAEAQTETETEVWSGTVTVSAISGTHGHGYLAAAHPITGTGGTLSSDDDFDIGSTTYTVWRITIDTSSQEYRPRFAVATGSTPAVADLPDKDELILRLTYDGEAGDFTLSDATYTDSSGTADSQGFVWSTGAGHPGATPTVGETMTVALLRTSTNNAPTVANTIPNQSAMVGTVFNYTVPDDTFTDADSDTLTYAATLDGGNELPSWLSFTAATRAFSGTPTAAQTVSVQVTASDGNGGSVSDFFDIVVSAGTTTSVSGALVSNLNQSATSGGYGSGGTGHYFQDGGTDDLAQGFTTGTNATGYTLTSIEIPFAEDISAADIADLTVSLHADDGSGNNPAATALFALDNPASIDGNIGFHGSIPTDLVAATHEFAVPAANTTTTFTMSTDYYVVLTYDQDVGIWYVEGDSWDSGAAPGWSIATRSRYKRGSGSWTANPVGVPLMIRVNGTTVGGTPVTNAAPTVANPIDDQTATVGTALDYYEFPADTFADTDAGDTLTYTATKSDDTALPLWLSFAAATRTFSGTPQAADVETLSVKVTASDGTDSVSDTFDIVVSAAPVCAAPDFGTRRNIWTSTVDVEAISVLGSVVSYGFDSGTGAGSLADNTFEIGSNDYTVGGIADVVTDIFQFTLTSSLTSTEVAALKLHVCETGYDFADATHNSSTHLYEFAVDLDWSMETTRTVYLSLPANRPATGDLEITGTAQVGQELTADVTAVADADGIVSSTAIYQWFRIDAGTETAIPGRARQSPQQIHPEGRRRRQAAPGQADLHRPTGRRGDAHQRGVSVGRDGGGEPGHHHRGGPADGDGQGGLGSLHPAPRGRPGGRADGDGDLRGPRGQRLEPRPYGQSQAGGHLRGRQPDGEAEH